MDTTRLPRPTTAHPDCVRTILASVSLLTAATLTGAERPNILWVVSEDHTYAFAGAYGDPLARTPTFDRLAHEGILFPNAYSTAPVCAPSRASIITGVYATSLGLQHMRSEHPLPSGVRFFPEYLRESGYFCTNNAKTDYNTSTPHAGAWDENGLKAHWRHRVPGQPFFSVFNFSPSHESSVHSRRPLTTDPARVRVPAYLPDNGETRADIAQYYDSVSRADAAVGVIIKQLEEDGLAEDTIVFYYSDNGGVPPRSKRFLYDNGTHVALAVYFPKKYRHLAPVESGSRYDGLINFVDFAPTVLNLAGCKIPAYMQGRAFAGPNPGRAPACTLQARDRMDERYDFSRALSDGKFRYVRNYRPDLTNGRRIEYLWRQASMREWARLYSAGKLTAVQRAFFEPKPAEQLFDCSVDPDNINNLAGDPAHREQILQFRSEMRAQLLRIRDTGFMPESLMVELAAGDSPARFSQDDSVYPLALLIDMVDLFQLTTPAAARIGEFLRHPLPVVRYWGIVANQGADSSGLVPLLADTNATVRLAAAEAIIRSGSQAQAAAWSEVTAALAPSNFPPLRLAAANVVADNTSFPPASLAALKKLPGLKEQNFSIYFENLLNLVTTPDHATDR